MPELDNLKHERFAKEYLKDYNATAAARRCGYSDDHGRTLTRDPVVKARITELRDELTDRTEITTERIARAYTEMAFYDARDMAAVLDALASKGQGTGELAAALSELPRAVTAPIKEMSAKVDTRGNVTYTVKGYDKQRALDVLASRYWTSDNAGDGFIDAIRQLREGDVPDLSEDVSADEDLEPDVHNTEDDLPAEDVPKWRKDRG
jgi:phage terminase small subunit